MDWINNVIFAAVKRTGKTPPIMVRTWGIDLPHMRRLVGNYPRLYTEHKYNVEMVAGTAVDPAQRGNGRASPATTSSTCTAWAISSRSAGTRQLHPAMHDQRDGRAGQPVCTSSRGKHGVGPPAAILSHHRRCSGVAMRCGTRRGGGTRGSPRRAPLEELAYWVRRLTGIYGTEEAAAAAARRL